MSKYIDNGHQGVLKKHIILLYTLVRVTFSSGNTDSLVTVHGQTRSSFFHPDLGIQEHGYVGLLGKAWQGMAPVRRWPKHDG